MNAAHRDILTLARRASDVINSCTVWPWVVSVAYQTMVNYGHGQHEALPRFTERTVILQRPMGDAPDGLDLVPVDGQFIRARIYPATRFEDMPASIRARHKGDYMAFLKWKASMVRGKDQEALEPWADYDPIQLDETVERWAKPGVRFAGD